MGILVRAIISGFGMSLGAALFRKVAKEIGLEDEKNAKPTETTPPPAPDRDDADLARATS
jgi:hypothetical protein